MEDGVDQRVSRGPKRIVRRESRDIENVIRVGSEAVVTASVGVAEFSKASLDPHDFWQVVAAARGHANVQRFRRPRIQGPEIHNYRQTFRRFRPRLRFHPRLEFSQRLRLSLLFRFPVRFRGALVKFRRVGRGPGGDQPLQLPLPVPSAGCGGDTGGAFRLHARFAPAVDVV